MGKPLNQQRRGKGSPVFSAPSHLYAADVEFRRYDEREKNGVVEGVVVDFILDPARSGLLMNVLTEEQKTIPLIAPEGIAIGDKLQFGVKAKVHAGNVLPLREIPDGTPVYNIELEPGDGGKLVRSAGGAAHIVSHANELVWISLPSKRIKILDEHCRAQVGIVSCGGRLEKPIFKAGKAAHMYRPKARYWPHVRGVAMNPVDHPFGGSQHHAGRSTCVSRGAPPGQKVGLIGARQSGRRKGKKRVMRE